MRRPTITTTPRGREGTPVVVDSAQPIVASAATQTAMDRFRAARQEEIIADGDALPIQAPLEPGTKTWGFGSGKGRRGLRVAAATGLVFGVAGCTPFWVDSASNETETTAPETGLMTVLIDGKPVEVTVTDANGDHLLGNPGDTYIDGDRVVTIGATTDGASDPDGTSDPETIDTSTIHEDFHIERGAQVTVRDGVLTITQPNGEVKTVELDGRGIVLKSDANITPDGGTERDMHDDSSSTAAVAYLLPGDTCGVDEDFVIDFPHGGGNLEVTPLDKSSNDEKTFAEELGEAFIDQTQSKYPGGALVYDMGQGGRLVATIHQGDNLQEVVDSLVGTEDLSNIYQDFRIERYSQVTVRNGVLTITKPDGSVQTYELDGRGIVLKSDANITPDGGTERDMHDDSSSTAAVAFLIPGDTCGVDEDFVIDFPHGGGNLEIAPLGISNEGRTFAQEMFEAFTDQTNPAKYPGGAQFFDMGQDGKLVATAKVGANGHSVVVTAGTHVVTVTSADDLQTVLGALGLS